MQTVRIVLALAAAGCGSYWDLRPGEELVQGCAGLLNYYPDADGDNWGEPDSVPTALCGPDDASGLTASNDLDCDESDAEITGRAGAICPGEMAGGAPCVFGQRQGESEFVGTCDASPLVAFGAAAQDCQAWAGWETAEVVAAGGAGHRGLAALQDEFEYVDALVWLTARAAGAPTAVWVDLRWEGSVSEGQWVWPDGSTPTFIAPCGGTEPLPGDFWPDLSPGQAESDAALESQLDQVRLALVYDGVGWCRGVPAAAGLPYEERLAHVLCERPRPDLADYASAPASAPAETTP